MDKALIETRKLFSRLSKECRQNSKQHECLWCGKKTDDFCLSHTIPRCILKNIAIEGKVSKPDPLTDFVDEDVGIASIEKFPLICKKCDSRIFQDYEDIKKLRSMPTERMLEVIALKDLLYHIWKRHFEIAWFDHKDAISPLYPTAIKQEINRMDLDDFLWDYHRIKKMIDGDGAGSFKLIFWKKLEYVVPVAFQGQISVYGDLTGNIVTNIYDWQSDNRITHMHLCIFPLESESIVFAFYHEDDHEYDSFAEQLQSLGTEELLSIISYLVMVCSEDFALARKFPHRTYCMEKMKRVYDNHQVEFWTGDKDVYEWELKTRLLWLKRRKQDFPVYLGPRHAMR